METLSLSVSWKHSSLGAFPHFVSDYFTFNRNQGISTLSQSSNIPNGRQTESWVTCWVKIIWQSAKGLKTFLWQFERWNENAQQRLRQLFQILTEFPHNVIFKFRKRSFKTRNAYIYFYWRFCCYISFCFYNLCLSHS